MAFICFIFIVKNILCVFGPESAILSKKLRCRAVPLGRGGVASFGHSNILCISPVSLLWPAFAFQSSLIKEGADWTPARFSYS